MVPDSASVPDLLHPSPMLRIDPASTGVAITLAFAGGVAGGLFSDTLDRARFAPSTWEPAGFASDLFLARFVTQCFKLRVGGEEVAPLGSHLVQLLARPPADPEIVQFRRAIVGELDGSAERRAALERLYWLLSRLRALLENASGTQSWDPNRRQLDILGLLKEVVDCMSSGFEGAQSGLARLGQFGARVQSSEPYRALSDLLRYDAQLATVSLRLGIGADGRIRGFELLAVNEEANNPFVSPPWRRWLAKVELFLRGFRFGDGEVMARLIDAVFTGLEREVVTLVQLFGDLEFYLGALGFADGARAAGLDVCLPEIVAPEQERVLLGLFNPLLLANGVKPVPCDVAGDRSAATVLVTGPNSGGKTRLLQALGLTQLLAQNGVFVPARAGTVALASALVVSLIQETRADQTEGRLGMELMRIRELFERLPPNAMVLLDELCSGTNPSEGEEIFELVLTMLARLEPQSFITTHFLTFASRLEREQKIRHLSFLQVELGVDRRPTYQFQRGVARTSLAGHTAERLGVTGEQLLSLVDRNLRQWRAPVRGLG